MIEFTLIGIPILFVLISTFEMARGMWIYTTLAHAVREGSRYAIVHGRNCASPPHQCTITVADVAARMQTAGVGLLADQLTVTMRSASGGNNLVVVGPATLQSTLGNATVFPGGAASVPGNDVSITATYPFRSAIAMFWPGASGMNFTMVQLPASSRDKIQF